MYMPIILRYPDGKRVSALLLSREETRLRVTIPGRSDTLELRKVRERWVDDDGNKVSIEALLHSDRRPEPEVGRAPTPEAAAGPSPPGSSAPARSRCTASG